MFAVKEKNVRNMLRIARLLAGYPEVVPQPSLIQSFSQLPKEEVCITYLRVQMIEALSDLAPARFFKFLKEVGFLSLFFPELEKLVQFPSHLYGDRNLLEHSLRIMDFVMLGKGANPALRFSALCHELNVETVSAMIERLSLPEEWARGAITAIRWREIVEAILAEKETPEQLAELKAFPGGVKAFLSLCIADGLQGVFVPAIENKVSFSSLTDLLKQLNQEINPKKDRIRSQKLSV